MKKEKTLTIAQKEKIIEQRVKEHEKDPNRRICFYVKGDGYTRLVRDAWASDMPIHALQKLCVEGLSMPLELGIKIVTGKAMLILFKSASCFTNLPAGTGILFFLRTAFTFCLSSDSLSAG